MNLIILFLTSGIILLIAYFTYGKFVAGKIMINNKNITPAHRLEDGVDYIPSKTPVVLGHHFASIAGAGPIVGPIIAIAFGWIPAVIWILVGGIFFGAVHDLTSMVASMRHDGKSIGVIIQKYIGQQGKQLFLIFSFATLILIIGVFADIIAKTFVNNPGVASASMLFIVLAIVFGMVNKLTSDKKGAFVITSIIGVVLMYYFVYLGVQIPFLLDYKLWVVLLMAYAFVASVTPVSFLLQPRDYLNSFLLYGLMIFAVIGVLVANPEIKMDNQVDFSTENLGYLFPVLFVTIACGAISGFHSLVASGTTSKQINQEKDAKVIGFGGMLIESFLAIISVGAVIVISRTEYASRLSVEGPVTMFADGLGGIISSTGISASLATSFVALTVSAFALTTLDTCTRLARFTFQEYFEDVDHKAGKVLSGNRYLATFLVVVLSVLLLTSGEFTTLWPIFGSANQLLAALALLAVAIWLIKRKVKPTFVLIPMFFMFAVTLSSLLLFAIQNFNKGIYVLSVLAGLLFLLSVVLIWLAKESLKKELNEPDQHLEKV
ncbi:carbon starvation CstA family protein [Catalinimonas niigatensis]|uniref:carbon starvation CstA family protein n=1 Tax=Catalinimonas niigatensis TaxID=1397264 RepID=UPI002665D3F8|nr:carbon starvation protein A [Catalinimonas niigatensis]WPP50497.1 carbon starvation protein A [Catalinimonas niigatensis]